MAYITTSDLLARLGTPLYARLTDRVNGTTADSGVAQEIVSEAEGLANAHLARRYATPVDLSAHPEVAAVLRARVLDVAEHLAWRTSAFTTAVPDRVVLVQDEALRWFEAVGRGEILLPAAAAPASTKATDDAPRSTSSARKFTADELDGL